jgi:hypothetical protein
MQDDKIIKQNAKPKKKVTVAQEKTIMFPLGHKPFNPRTMDEDEAMLLFSLGQVNAKAKEDKEKENVEEDKTAIT